MIEEPKPDSLGPILGKSLGAGKRRSPQAKAEEGQKINLVMRKEDLKRMIEQIEEEVRAHQRLAKEIEEKMEKLATAAFDELLKVRELKEIIEKLNKEASFSSEKIGAGPVGEKRLAWKEALDQTLERLLAIKNLLDNPLAPRKEKKKKILVVDDDPTTVKIIAHFLEKENFTVSTSLSGSEGLKKAFQEKPDLILLDIMMPDLNGFQFLSIFQKDEQAARIPVIILSSLAEEAEVLRGLETGAIDYMTKPFSPAVLLAKIKKNLNAQP